MEHGRGYVSRIWAGDHGRRRPILDTARLAASLSKPWVLPPEAHHPHDELPENYQSTASRGIQNLEGKMILALYPPAAPWFSLELSPAIEFSPNVPDEEKQRTQGMLFLQQMQIMAQLQMSDRDGKARRRSGFRSRKRMAITQTLVTGDCLQRLHDDYRLQVFRRDQYVTRRDSAGDVLYHCTKEMVDPLALDEDMRAAAELQDDKLDRNTPAAKRMVELFTLVTWQPWARTWKITQEINRRIIAESEEPVTPYFSTTYELAPGEDYGRGFIELNLGDIRSHNELREKKLDYAAIASKIIHAIDENSMTREKDLQKPTGSIIRAKVRGGQVDDIATIGLDAKLADFNVVHSTDDAIRRDLGRAMLIESETIPEQDRVTATQVRSVVAELEGALGGIYSNIADDEQVPLLNRLMWQMQRDNKLASLPDDTFEVETLTGINALTKELELQKITGFVQILSQLGPDAMAKLDISVLVDTIQRSFNFYSPGMIKSDQQLAQEQTQAAVAQLAQQAGSQAIETTGAVAEQAAAQPAPAPE